MRACTPGGRATTSPPRKKKRNRLMKCDELGWNATTGPHGEENKPTCQCICNTRHTYIYIYIYTHTHTYMCVHVYKNTTRTLIRERKQKDKKRKENTNGALYTWIIPAREPGVSLPLRGMGQKRNTHTHIHTHTVIKDQRHTPDWVKETIQPSRVSDCVTKHTHHREKKKEKSYICYI